MSITVPPALPRGSGLAQAATIGRVDERDALDRLVGLLPDRFLDPDQKQSATKRGNSGLELGRPDRLLGAAVRECEDSGLCEHSTPLGSGGIRRAPRLPGML